MGVEPLVEALLAGRPALLPTDTVYGLCARADREDAVLAAYRLKGRPESVPSALLCAHVETLLALVPELREEQERVLRGLLPGAYTFVLPNPARRYTWLGGPRPEAIGVRVPLLPPAAREVLERVGAVMATSANHPGGRDPRRLADVPADIRAGCGAELDGGELPGVPSTVIDLTATEPRLLREGAVPAARALERIRSLTM